MKNLLKLTLVVVTMFAVQYECNTANAQDDADLSNKAKVVALLKSFNTGDRAPISYINPKKYTQHNLMVRDGLAGFAEVMKAAPPQGFKSNVIRALEDGEFVVTHTEYDFFGPKVGFDVFRFENGKIVEHWDNLVPIAPANPSGRTQLDGTAAIVDRDKTESNKRIVENLINDVFLNGKFDKITDYISTTTYLQHNSNVGDGLEALAALASDPNAPKMRYQNLHKVLGEGNFVLSISEGLLGDTPTSYYDLFRLENGKVVEHWDVIESILSPEQRKNNNGKFNFSQNGNSNGAATEHLLDGTALDYVYENGGGIAISFYEGKLKYKWTAGPRKGNGNQDLVYRSREIADKIFVVSWLEQSHPDYVTLIFNFTNNTMYSSGILRYGSENQKVVFDRGRIERLEMKGN